DLPRITEQEALRSAGPDFVYYATQLRGASNAKAKRELGFAPRRLEWLHRTISQTRSPYSKGVIMPDTSKRGMEVLRDPALNKSTAFTEAERESLGLVGLLPDVPESEDLQVQRVMLQLSHKNTDLDRYIYLMNLLDHDETLFYRTVMS